MPHMVKSLKEKLTQSNGALTFSTFMLILAASIGLRFLHLDQEIDGPHSWRQCDTANYIWNFYENGVDFFQPTVCWMGQYQTLILEFALPEALAAWAFDLFGASNLTSRLVFLSFFCLGIFYFYKICRQFLEEGMSQLASILYTFLPLAYYYSRAIHIDYFALTFAFGMFYYYYLGITKSRTKYLVLGSMFASIAFLVKAPYALPFCFPLLYLVHTEKKWPFTLRNSLIFLIPVGLFIWWIKQAAFINSQAPDWSFIPGYRKFDDNNKWYFGSFEHRFLWRSWKVLASRAFFDLSSGPLGLFLVATGMFVSRKKKELVLLWLWLGGILVYFFIFFNLNVIHNYYQIPFVPVFAIFIALGIGHLSQWPKSTRGKKWTQFILATACIANCIYFAESQFFNEDTEYIGIAAQIEKRSQKQDLILVSHPQHSVHCPWILHRANRNGWSVSPDILTPEIISRLAREGCRYLAYLGQEMPENLKTGRMEKDGMEVIDFPNEEGLRLFWVDLGEETN